MIVKIHIRLSCRDIGKNMPAFPIFSPCWSLWQAFGGRDQQVYLHKIFFLIYHFLSSTFLWKKVEPKPLTAQGAFLSTKLSRMAPRLSPSQPLWSHIFGLLGFRHAPRAAGRQTGDKLFTMPQNTNDADNP